MGQKYVIFYTVWDEWLDMAVDSREEFEGTWDELQDYIKILRNSDWCWNIDVVDVTPECYEE